MENLKSFLMKTTLITILFIIGALSVAAPSVDIAFYIEAKEEELVIEHDNKFIEGIAPTILKVLKEEKEKGTKVPLPSVVLAMAYHETAQGTTSLCKKGNNYFGIKASKACKKNPKCKTMSLYDDDYEIRKGKRVKVKSKFQVYTSFEENFKHCVEKLNTATYVKGLDKKTPKEQIQYISKNWATDKLYTVKILKIIKTNELYKFDKKFL